METAKFTFVPLKDKISVLEQSKISNKLMQWSMKGNLKLKYYNFNQEFHPYQKQDFIEAFFKDPAVYSTLEVYRSGWDPIGIPAAKVEYEPVAATQTSMAFFDRILDRNNNMTRPNGEIRQCFEDKREGFYIDDNILAMLLVEEHDLYNLYSKSERNEFIFNIFKHIYLGGEWCQRDFNIEPYLQTTKDIYKDLMSVERIEGSSDIRVRSVVFKVFAYQKDGTPLCPKSPHHLQNFTYLIVDPFKRQLSVLTNYYGGCFE
ncbi:cilia- and flagella-associated protein 300 [Halyomorpha halys]|uniref:cilia- and flagella-associated protein 300 n=1 Tax=Halyomorpha halys TaxID=286706 RepID=UPI000D0C81B1|nr:uncharacterized protein C11orf70 homolog [Halyomorpha halys]